MKRSFVIVCILIAILLMCGCTAGDQNALPSSKYVALEEYMATNCTLIEGTHSFSPHITLMPPFNYDGAASGSNWADGDSRQDACLDGYYPAVNDSFKALYGTAYYHDIKPMDTRTGLRVRGIYGFPYILQSGFSIDRIDKNGTVFGTYNNTSIVLKAGDQWATPVSTVTAGKNGTDLDNNTYSYVVDYDTTWTISNLGIFDKTDISRYNNSGTATGFTSISGGADPSEQ